MRNPSASARVRPVSPLNPPVMTTPSPADAHRASYEIVDEPRLDVAWPQVAFLALIMLATFLPFAVAFLLAA